MKKLLTIISTIILISTTILYSANCITFKRYSKFEANFSDKLNQQTLNNLKDDSESYNAYWEPYSRNFTIMWTKADDWRGIGKFSNEKNIDTEYIFGNLGIKPYPIENDKIYEKWDMRVYIDCYLERDD